MCGIAGIFDRSGKPVDQDRLHAMDTAITHRGPDGHGEIIKGSIGIANRRLAIIDPHPSGNQPLQTHDKRYAITFNGEIFNYLQIRHLLEKKRYSLQTHTDTEVILYGYVAWGPKIVEKLIGQFAFCIVDFQKKECFLARDRLGINPLFYSFSGNRFIFSSEVKGIVGSGYVQRTIDRESLHTYLSMFCIPAPRTIFSEIKSLLPGTTLTVSAEHSVVHPYYQIPLFGLPLSSSPLQGPISADTIALPPVHQVNGGVMSSEGDAIKEVRRTVMSCVTDAMVSDVSVGAFLSGGIDSSIVVACMAQTTDKPIQTFSLWAEGGEAFDERPYANMIAKRYHTDHREETVSEEDVVGDMPVFIRGLDQPSGGSLESYFVSKLAGSSVRVALSGLGGDELFGGYHGEIYRYHRLSSWYRMIPSYIRSALKYAIGYCLTDDEKKKRFLLGEAFLGLPTSLDQRLFYYHIFSDKEKHDVYIDPPHDIKDTKEYFSEFWGYTLHLHDIDRLSYLDLSTYTRDDLVLGMNMVSMAHSLEVRVPFLDHRLLSVSARIPPRWKYHNGVGKYILKKAFEDLLPTEVIHHKKTGFGLPRVQYMRGALKPMILDALSERSIKKRGIFRPDAIQKEVQKFYAYKESEPLLWREHLRLWSLFTLELWMREFLD